MSDLRKQAVIRLLLCLLALVVSITFSVVLISDADDGKGVSSGVTADTVSENDAAASDSVAESVSDAAADGTTEPAAEDTSEPVAEPAAEETPAPAETTTFDGLSEQPTTVYAEGEQINYATPDDANMNLRAGPGTDTDKLAQVPLGTVVTALGTNADGTWVVVQYDGQYGWLSAEYLTRQ